MQDRPAKGANWVLALLIFINVINMVDRNLISSFGPQITEELALSDLQFGMLTGLLFVFFYAIMGLFVGRLADIMHRPKLIAAGLFLWSALTIFSGAAKNFVQIGVARLFIGVGESCLSPAAMSMLSDLYPQNKRGMASGLYYLGLPLGAGASFVVAGVFGPQIGWRNCFYVLGAFGLLLTPLLYFMRDPLRGAYDAAAEGSLLKEADGSLLKEADGSLMKADGSSSQESKAAKSSTGVLDAAKLVWGLMRRSPALVWAMVGAVFMHLPIGAAQFVTLWLVRERGFDAAEITLTYGLLFIVFGTLGAFIGGFASDWYLQRFKGGRLRFLGIFMLMVTPLMLGYRFVSPDSPLFYIGMCAGFVAFIAFFGPVFSTVQDLVPADLRGITTAVLLLMCNLVGLGMGAVAAGVLSEVYQAMEFAEPLTLSLLTIDAFGVFTVASLFIGSFYWQRQMDSHP